LGPESGADSVAALENSTTIPCTLHLVFTAFRAQPFGPVAIFAHFGVARRSHATLHHPITPCALNCIKTVTSGETNNVETASSTTSLGL